MGLRANGGLQRGEPAYRQWLMAGFMSSYMTEIPATDQGVSFQLPFSTVSITRALSSRPKWSFDV